MIMTAQVRQCVPEHQADGGAKDPDQESLRYKDLPDLRRPRSHRAQHRDVFGLFMTIMVSAITMLRAATKTMSPMVMNVTTFSRLKALNKALFCSIQLVAMNPDPAARSSS